MEVYLSFFAALFALLDPLGNLPIFIGQTARMRPDVRRALAVLVSLSILIALLLFLFTGQAILAFSGISFPAFRIAGGIILLWMGIGMVNGHTAQGETLGLEG